MQFSLCVAMKATMNPQSFSVVRTSQISLVKLLIKLIRFTLNEQKKYFKSNKPLLATIKHEKNATINY